MNHTGAVITLIGLIVSYFWWTYTSDNGGKSYEQCKWRNPSGLDLVRGVHLKEAVQYLNAPVLNPRIVKVTEGVHVAIDYAFGNSIFLEAPQGLVIVDATESSDAARKMLKDYRQICNKSLVAVIYTHHHADHIQGTHGFIEDPSKPLDIWAHIKQKEQLYQLLLARPLNIRGGVYQFGLALAELGGAESGVNPRFLQGLIKSQTPLLANKYVKQDIEQVNIAGLNITFIYQPGESDDEMGVWLEDSRVLMSGDNIYPEFPNLYSIRGVAPRSARHWYESLIKLRNLNSQYLVSSHGDPVVGVQQVHDALNVYISAVRYIHDQTVRLMNQGLHPDEIATRIKLPASLANHPDLKEEYGMIAWSSKGVFQQQVGWFSGDPVDLMPHPPRERAQRLVRMVGEAELLRNAELAMSQNDPQWALELSTSVLTVNELNAHAKDVRTEALRTLAGRQTNPVARNYYLTATFDDHQLIDWKKIISNSLSEIDISVLYNLMTVRLNPQAVDGMDVTVMFYHTDTEDIYRLQVLHSVLHVQCVSCVEDSAGSYDVKVNGSSEIIKKVLIRDCSPFSTCGDERIVIVGSPEIFRKFLSFFEM